MIGSASFPFKTPQKSSSGSHLLKEIADVIGISVNKLTEPAQPHILHMDDDGTCWLLITDTQGSLVVRCTYGSVSGHDTTEESVPNFLARDIGTPQHRALIALIDRLLVMHLAR